jgi:prolyl-tRNA synthetase
MDKKKLTKGIVHKKEEDFSEWYSEIVARAELADLRYNIKGFVCYMPWAVISIKRMYELYEKALERKGHLPLIMPSLIPESNFNLESDHVKGFTPQVFWVTEAGDGERMEERLALRPTSETALYKMYSMWIRSYNDLPFKRYQSCQVWRYEGKATRPFFRAREFHWIEAHNVFATLDEAKAQVIEDMQTTKEMLEDEFAMPFIFFERPQWDKFAGAINTYAADALMDSGKVIQLPSTHLLGTNFSVPFNVKFTDKDGEEKLGFITCYGPAISRIYGAMVAILGDNQGLVLPFKLAPIQFVIVPIVYEENKTQVIEKCKEIERKINKHYDVKIDENDSTTPGEKFNFWEMKGVPFRIEIGPKDIEKRQVVVVRRLDGKKFFVEEKDLMDKIKELVNSYTDELKSKHFVKFDSMIKKCKSVDEIKKTINSGKIACAGFCSIGLDGAKCAEIVEKETGAEIRGSRVDKDDNIFEKCVVCGKPAKKTVYIAKSY